VSEIMLQQTQVASAISHYDRWMQRFPTVQALARASEDDVLGLWQGLGYYSRARALLEGARQVVSRHAGCIPREVAVLRSLPGIGPYSAGAIASLAYGVRTPAVDGNVTRVICRYCGLRGDPTRAALRARIWEIAASWLVSGPPDEINEALMELGATVCLPRTPGCKVCPIRSKCVAARAGMTHRIPAPRPRPRVTRGHEVAALVCRRGRWLLEQIDRAAPRWPGMWRFPTRPNLDALQGFRVTRKLTEIDYRVTRYRMLLEAYSCTLRGDPEGRWVAPSQLDALAMPAAHRRLARFVQAGIDSGHDSDAGGRGSRVRDRA
jgi:A/G-specific adenine glycosylase